MEFWLKNKDVKMDIIWDFKGDYIITLFQENIDFNSASFKRFCGCVIFLKIVVYIYKIPVYTTFKKIF